MTGARKSCSSRRLRAGVAAGVLELGLVPEAGADAHLHRVPLSVGVAGTRVAHQLRLARPVADPAGPCEAAITGAETRYQLPPGLLEAIALVESGRRDRAGRLRPWSWTVNAQNQGCSSTMRRRR